MIDLRPFEQLHNSKAGDWLDARFHFSFSNYFDPERMNWGRLRVWNDDRIGPRSGFPPHPHENMEIITYVRGGKLTHKDNMGNVGVTSAGNVQVMSAGSGVVHAEYNAEDEDEYNFQIWIESDQRGGDSYWELREFPKDDRAGQWVVLASGDPEADDALPIRCDARVLGATVRAGDTLSYTPSQSTRHQYLVPSQGRIRVNGVEAKQRDGLAITQEDQITIEALEDSELVMVDSL
ncbi:pirin family protein [Altericroceibacterium endophyticum]|uniref:Pirin family protein n=1 Tax=Altericroceibacterium endophyticum TaxID=1808508 RepID=A0A6I4T734_9SPHN|nr:pirin family protein [Altericroceibacterium endophyticum]MXO66022.1 hypothetical protein [Altericroceibacterium endophyticum]